MRVCITDKIEFPFLLTVTYPPQLDPDALIDAITRTVFVLYSIICVVLATILAILSNRPIGQELVWIDLGLCALFGELDLVKIY